MLIGASILRIRKLTAPPAPPLPAHDTGSLLQEVSRGHAGPSTFLLSSQLPAAPTHLFVALPLTLTVSKLGMGSLSLTLPDIQHVLSKYVWQERTDECPS